MILKDISSARDFFFGYVKARLNDMIEKDFKEEFQRLEELKIPFTYNVIGPVYDIFENAFQSHKGHMTRRFVLEQFVRQSTRTESTTMTTYTCYKGNPGGAMEIVEFQLHVSEYAMALEILDSLTDLSSLERHLDFMFRHEIGHIIDALRFHGGPVEDYESYHAESDRLKDEYYKWFQDCGKSRRDPIEAIRRYYAIPVESMANKLGGANLDDLIRTTEDDIARRKKKTTLEIKVLSVKEGDDVNDN